MATETTNYHLIKPGDTDPVDNAPLNQNFDSIDAAIADHVADTNNPHQVTKEQVGLGNVDNVATKDVLARLVDAGAKNLLNHTVYTRTVNGVTYTVNVDMSITITSDGTNTQSLLYLTQNAPLAAGTYILSGCTGGSSTTYDLRVKVGDTITNNYDGGTEFSSYGTIETSIVVRAAQTLNITIEPMVCTKAAWDISQKYVPHRPSYDELIARVEALEQAAGINTRSVATLTTESAADTTETEGGEVR